FAVTAWMAARARGRVRPGRCPAMDPGATHLGSAAAGIADFGPVSISSLVSGVRAGLRRWLALRAEAALKLFGNPTGRWLSASCTRPSVTGCTPGLRVTRAASSMCLGHGGGCDAWFDAPRRGGGGGRASPCRGRTARQARKPKKRCATVRRRSSSRGKDRPMKQSKPLSVIVALGALLGTLGGLLTVSPALASVPAGASARGWSVTPSPNPVIPAGQLFWVSCPAANLCMGVGTYTTASGGGVALAELWSGTAWRIQPGPSPPGAAWSNLFGVSCGSPSACEAVGTTASRSGAQTALAERWNGRRWQLQPTPNLSQGGGLNGVSCSSASACTAVGASGAGPLAERWDGARWSIQATPNPPQGNGFLSGVSCTSTSACIAAGASNPFTPSAQTPADPWNGPPRALQRTPHPPHAVRPPNGA